jgi:phosphohistidine phosphatase SixA
MIDCFQRLLTPKGWAQCRAASVWFGELDVRALLSSPARRAADTAVAMRAQVSADAAS